MVPCWVFCNSPGAASFFVLGCLARMSSSAPSFVSCIFLSFSVPPLLPLSGFQGKLCVHHVHLGCRAGRWRTQTPKPTYTEISHLPSADRCAWVENHVPCISEWQTRRGMAHRDQTTGRAVPKSVAGSTMTASLQLETRDACFFVWAPACLYLGIRDPAPGACGAVLGERALCTLP